MILAILQSTMNSGISSNITVSKTSSTAKSSKSLLHILDKQSGLK